MHFSCTITSRSFFLFHIYLIQQGQTTNETFKWAKLMKKHNEMVAAHELYLELKEPENILKVENMSSLSDRHYLDPRTEQFNAMGPLSDTSKVVTKSKYEISKVPGQVNFSPVNMVQHVELGSDGSDDMVCTGDSSGTRNVCGSECTWERSDSTSDGADSADIEVQCSSEKRKVGSSSSGSTSSSKRDSYGYDSDDDFLLVDDSEDDNGYCKITHLAEGGSQEQKGVVAAMESLEKRVIEPVIAISDSCRVQESHNSHTSTPPKGCPDLFSLDSCPKFLSRPPGCVPTNIYKKGFLVGMKNVWTPPSLAALTVLEKALESKAVDAVEVECIGGRCALTGHTKEEEKVNTIVGDSYNDKINMKIKST
jgi:hypothetical protein